MESRTRGSRPRPRAQKNSEGKAKDRPSRGQGQELRKQAQAFSKKKGLQKFFSGEKGLQKLFPGDLHLRKTEKCPRKFPARFLVFSNKISLVQKIVLSSSRRQDNFCRLEASRPRTSKCVLEYSTSDKDQQKQKQISYNGSNRQAVLRISTSSM